jgi:hypothetical protein
MKAIIAQMKNYNDQQERKRQKNKEMNAKNALEGIKGNNGDVSHIIDLVMATNTQESHTTTITMSYVLTVITFHKRCINIAQQ